MEPYGKEMKTGEKSILRGIFYAARVGHRRARQSNFKNYRLPIMRNRPGIQTYSVESIPSPAGERIHE